MSDPEELSTHVPATVRITVAQGPGVGQVFEDVPLPTVVGRSKSANVQLEDDPQSPTISRRHVLLALRGGRLSVQDLSTNGTRVGSTLLSPGEALTVSGEAVITLGQRTIITVEVHWPNGQAPEPVVDSPDAMPLTLRTLGTVEVRVNGTLVPHQAFQTRKAVALLAFLALRPGVPQDPQRLCEAVWPESDGGTKATLQSTVSRLRKALKATEPSAPDPIVLVRNLYTLNPSLRVDADARMFEDLCQSDMERAVQMYGGPFMEGYTEEWIELHRVRLQRLYLEALEALAERSPSDEAMRYYQRMLQTDTCCEAGHIGLIRCLASSGQREAAVRQYQDCTRLLKKHLDLPPGDALQEVYRRLVEQADPAGDPKPPPSR